MVESISSNNVLSLLRKWLHALIATCIMIEQQNLLIVGATTDSCLCKYFCRWVCIRPWNTGGYTKDSAVTTEDFSKLCFANIEKLLP
jgi:hypothetical protein